MLSVVPSFSKFTYYCDIAGKLYMSRTSRIRKVFPQGFLQSCAPELFIQLFIWQLCYTFFQALPHLLSLSTLDRRSVKGPAWAISIHGKTLTHNMGHIWAIIGPYSIWMYLDTSGPSFAGIEQSRRAFWHLWLVTCSGKIFQQEVPRCIIVQLPSLFGELVKLRGQRTWNLRWYHTQLLVCLNDDGGFTWICLTLNHYQLQYGSMMDMMEVLYGCVSPLIRRDLLITAMKAGLGINIWQSKWSDLWHW